MPYGPPHGPKILPWSVKRKHKQIDPSDTLAFPILEGRNVSKLEAFILVPCRHRERETSLGWERVKEQPDRGARRKETRERSVNLHGSEDKKGTREGEMPMGL